MEVGQYFTFNNLTFHHEPPFHVRGFALTFFHKQPLFSRVLLPVPFVL